MRMSRKASALAAVALGSLVAAVSAFGGPARQDATTVTVTAGKPSEFKFALSKTAAPKGAIAFKVTNKGKLKHDFKIAGKKTPLLATGKSKTVNVTLKPGKYAFLCTVAGHAQAGMKGTFTVRK